MKEEPIKLGKTDVLVSPLGVGAWQWGDQLLWGFGQGYGVNDIRSAFDSSLAAGVDFFDTAEVYGFGRSEKYLGEFTRESHRNVVIATKFFPMPWRITRGAIVSALRKSLVRLDMKRVDLYQIHSPMSLVSVETWMEGLADAVEQGLTRSVGVSNYNTAQTRRAHAALAKRGIPLASNQVEYSLLDRRPETNGLVNVCRELDVTLIAYSPLGKGLLTGKYSSTNPPPGRRRQLYKGNYLERIAPLVDLLRQIGKAHGGKTPAQVSLNWLICKATVPIPGAKNAKQAQENAGALGWRLDDAEVSALDESSSRVGKPR